MRSGEDPRPSSATLVSLRPPVLLIIEDHLQGQARTAGPPGIGRIGAVAGQVPGVSIAHRLAVLIK